MNMTPPPAAILSDLLTPGEPVWAKIARTAAIYLFLLILLRLGGKRELG